MASILPDYEYDIFISYRHNDNRSGWVTEFVGALRHELAATIKEPLSVYFDSNTYDGLLETHHVDKSLEQKLKSTILIPILSQTYCDTKSFAWNNEFCVFNQQANNDPRGRDITLSNGNVGSRILPVKIHDLDPEDIKTFEAEIGGALRCIEFIYKEPGVNRPLKPNDNRSDNQSKTDYRNQLNKVANAVKGIIYSIIKPNTGVTRTNLIPAVNEIEAKPSLVVLPFSNLSKDAEQEYFSDGITENIISELASNKALRIISRTSSMRFKNANKTASEIGQELNVKFILEGGVQTSGNKVRINVQLVEAETDDLSWSKVFIESLDDIFEIQNTVSQTVARELQASLAKPIEQVKEKAPTQNKEAYNLFLKGRHAFNQWNVEGYKLASQFFKQAIVLDSEFQEAYSYLASSFSARMSWNGDLAPNEALLHIEKYLTEAWKRGATENDYLTKAFVEFFITKDFHASEEHLLKAIDLNNNSASALYTYSYLLNMMGRFDEAFQCVESAKQIDPLTIPYFNYLTICQYLTKDYDSAIKTLDEALKLYPSVLRLYDFKARILLSTGNWPEAAETVTHGFNISPIRPASMNAWLAIAYHHLGNTDLAKEIINSLIAKAEAKEKGHFIYLVYSQTALGDFAAAKSFYERSIAANDVDLIWKDVDPLLSTFRAYLTNSTSSTGNVDFDAAEKFIRLELEAKMPSLPYHNLNHIQDVVQAAEVIASHESLSDNEKRVIRLAAWYHDAGFMQSPKEHEKSGAKLAEDTLPNFGFSTEEIAVIQNMIMATKLPQSPATLLEKVLCDADLDYLGRADFYERGNTLYQELKTQGVVETEREWNLVQKTFLEGHRYHTNYSKANRESSKQERLQEIIAKLKSRA